MSAHARPSIAASREDRPLAELIRFLDALTGDEPPGGLIEVRYREPGATMGQRFHRAERPELAARLILLLAQRHDVYVGCAPRRRRWGGRQAIERAWTLWADCDGPAARSRLARFEPQAAIVVRSGSAENRHAYWPLREPLDPRDAESANRRLAHALGADPAATDAARILRPPHTHNFKHDPPAPVLLERLSEDRQMADEIVAGLRDPRPEAARGASPDRRYAATTRCARSSPPSTSRPSPARPSAATARSTAPSTKTPAPACMSTRDPRAAGTASPAGAAPRSTTSPGRCGGSARGDSTSSSSGGDSKRCCCRRALALVVLSDRVRAPSGHYRSAPVPIARGVRGWAIALEHRA